MKTLYAILLTLLLFGLAACQPSGRTVIGKQTGPNPPQTPNPSGVPGTPSAPSEVSPTGSGSANGGIDIGGGVGGLDIGGGGNGVEKKTLEGWKIPDLNKLPAFERLHEKVISKLKVRFPKLAADIMHIAEERSWYLIPVELKTLPAAKIGVSFRIDQIALQKLKEIWISDLIFSKMEPQDQEILILHELLMGVHLLKFSNHLDQCLVNIAVLKLDPEQDTKYQEARRECFRKNRRAAEVGENLGVGQPIKLTESDYAETIRPLTNLLMEKIDTFDPQELEDWMVIQNFRKY